MSTSNQAVCETTVLLGDSGEAGQMRGSRSRERFSFSPETLLIPVALATRLATQVPSTTLVDLVRKAICRFWKISHDDPTPLPAGGPVLELCDAPEIVRYFSIVIAIIAALEGIISVVGCGVLSRVSSHYGRKPAFMVVLISGILGNCMVPGSQYVPDWLDDCVFLVGLVFGLFSSSLPYTYLVNLYIVDVCAPEDRTSALSKIVGWALLGTCVSYALGGSVTTKTGDPAIVFYVAAAIYFATFIYISFFLPESFPQEKRDALSRISAEPSASGLPATRLAALQIFNPLKMLVSARKLDGTRNWRLAWCATHAFVFTVANGYALTAWLVIVTSKYHLTPADTGLFLTIITVSGTIILTTIVPPLVRLLRPCYRREGARPLVVEEETLSDEELKLATSDRLDVHLAFASCVVTAVFYLSAAASKTNLALTLSAICIGFASLHAPTLRSLVAGSVDPLKQGEALAAVEMVLNAGSFLSPIIMGSILSATIESTPLLLFYVHLVVVLASSEPLFLVRDADRYQKPHAA